MPKKITFHVAGTPVTQGSLNISRNGYAYHQNNKKLQKWRNQITRVALEAMKHHGWETPLDEPLIITAHFHLRKPKRPRFAHMPATQQDLDKLTRAVGDALSPKESPKPIIDDVRIVQWVMTKSYGEPGVTLTIERDIKNVRI